VTERRLAWAERAGSAVLEATGWSPDELAELAPLDAAALARRFSVVPAEVLRSSPAAVTPMAGAFRLDGPALVFQPRFPFADGTDYAFLSWPDGLPGFIARAARELAATTAVAGIRPSTAELPLNALRVYVAFSAPMSEGASAHVRLLDAAGAQLEDAFVPMEPELWSPDRSRLTLLLDPGRIKRGLVPHEEAGYPLEAGGAVRLVVDAAARDSAGAPLAAPAERGYAVGPPERRRLDPRSWKLSGPRPGSREPLRLRADRPLDHALALRCIAVVDALGRPVAGRAELAEGDRDWSLAPAEPWGAEAYRLVVAPELEDLAGNSVTRVFDRDLGLPGDDPLPAEPVVLPLPPG